MAASLLTASYSRRAPITPPKRNPITQSDVQVAEFKSSKKASVRFDPSPEKREGIARGEFAEQMKRSFSLAYSEPEPYYFTKKMLCPEPYEPVHAQSSKRKADCTPQPRNPIIQEEIPYTPPKIRSKMTESNIFKADLRPKVSKFIESRQGL